MSRRVMVGVCVVTLLAPMTAWAQSAASDGSYVVPRTGDGHPDLQGLWTNDTITRFERPAELGDKAFYTAEEAVAMEQSTLERNAAANAPSAPSSAPPAGGNIGAYNQLWLDSGTTVLSTGRTSIVVEPANGRVPVKPWAEAKRAYDIDHVGDDVRHMSIWDRCVSRGVPGSMLPAGYNNAYRIMQTADHVVIQYEMIHDVRVIPVDDRRHIPREIGLWMGDSRAHWDGDTLVVETTNYHDRGWIASSAAGGRIKGIPVSEELHVVERFTRVSADTILWEATVEDPNVYTEPWVIQTPLTNDPGYVMFEYACHEGNLAVENILSGGRAVERAGTDQ
jgi:hypothetical protein